MKPTRFLLVHLPHVAEAVAAGRGGGRCWHPKGTHRVLQGRAPNGSWLTSPAKAYPAPLCSLLAQGFLQEAQDRWPTVLHGDEVEVPEAYKPFVVPLDHLAPLPMGRDYAANTRRRRRFKGPE